MVLSPRFQPDYGDGIALLQHGRPVDTVSPAEPSTDQDAVMRSGTPKSLPESHTHLIDRVLTPIRATTAKGRIFFKRMWQRIKPTTQSKSNLRLEPPITVAIRVEEEEIRRSGILFIDTGSPDNLISTEFLKQFPGVQYEEAQGVFGQSIQGHEMVSRGTIQIRWHCAKFKENIPGAREYSLAKFVASTCLVVDSNLFDVLIGKPTVDELNLFKANHPLVAPFRPVNIRADDNTIRQAEQQAKVVRERVKEEQRQRERDIKDKREKERRERELQEQQKL